MTTDEVLLWLGSCKCQRFGCGHVQAAECIVRLCAAGDALAEYLGGVEPSGSLVVRGAWRGVRYDH